MNTWTETDNTLSRLFTFSSFNEALQFVNRVGAVAEILNHHPNITLQNYKEVLVVTTTHDAGNIVTEKDRALAAKIDLLY